jgi:acyl CoA:acetate/3-ketoacid CoA transferase beta subunit
VFVGGSSNQCLGVLGGGQIDKYGNGNSTKLPGIGYLVGSGGANDIANGNRETVVVINSGKQRLVEKVPYVTFSGKHVKTLVTDVGVFEKTNGEDTFTLTTYVPSRPGQTAEEAIGEIRDKVGWGLKVSPNLEEARPIAKEEVTLLRLFDPKGFYT